MIEKDAINEYNKQRPVAVRDKLCHAPFSSINFEQNGNMTACCFNRVNVLGKYPKHSIEEAWLSQEAQNLRKKIVENNLTEGCKLCGIFIKQGNYQGTKAIYYDEYAHQNSGGFLKRLLGLHPKYFPKVFEFEISNTCNLACNMCSGYYSSTIRKKREKLPDIHQPYDDNFVEQVGDFLPTLTDLKFLGGEPFLIDIYYKIWEKVIAVNPKVKIHITTNGTVFNNRVKKILTQLNAGFVLSIDSVNKEMFESIRIGAKFETVMANFEEFRDIAQKKGTYLSIAACAMNNNWKGFPDLVNFANEKEVSLHFNVVWNPGHLSMRYMDFYELEEIEAYLKSFRFNPKSHIERNNVRAYEELIQTVSMWKLERDYTKLNNLDSFEDVPIVELEVVDEIKGFENIRGDMAQLLLNHYFSIKSDKENMEIAFSRIGQFDANIKLALFSIWQEHGDHAFTKNYFELIPVFAKLFYGSSSFDVMHAKATGLKQYIQNMKEQQAVISDLIDDIDKKSILNQLQLLHGNELEAIIEHIKSNY